ncbi:hypothetical protein QCE62_28550 [Caballeronia sp. LZ033]|uniref:hypothetical protein n=1 Tax=Caballeronia sp. LZ033 TaxID=3038566 RepID=UPI00285D64CD|nr:hypothetical protein [Caballeronia sp. LZ033]MDR5817563.1 hypothetical protein [Caballeronia sp. LZ033]
MTIRREMRRVANAFASVFSIYPRTDYLANRPLKSPAEMMDDAWQRTMSDFDRTLNGYGQRQRNR